MTEIIQKARLTFFGIDDELKDDTSSIYTTVLNSTNFPAPQVDSVQTIDGVTFTTKAAGFTNRLNTKRYRFTINKNQVRMLNLSNKAKLVIESVCLPNVLSQSFLQSKNINNITLRMMGISNNNHYDSSTKGKGSTIIFSCPVMLNTQGYGVGYSSTILPDLINVAQKPRMNSDNNGNLYINTSPEHLYSFTITENFISNGVFEFELIFDVGNCFKNTATNNAYEYIPQTLDITTDKNDLEAFQISFIIMDYDEEKEKVYNSKELLNKINKLVYDKEKFKK